MLSKYAISIPSSNDTINASLLIGKVKADEITVVDFPSDHPTHRIEFEGHAISKCENLNIFGFSHDVLNTSSVQTVSFQTFLTKWVSTAAIISIFFDLEAHERYYAFSNIGVDLTIVNDEYRLYTVDSGYEREFKYRLTQTYQISNRQTNCTFYNIKITIPEIKKIKCTFELNFTPSAISKNRMYLIVGLAVSIIVILSIVSVTYILYKKRIYTQITPLKYTVSNEK
ncbi:hypothetical protein RF11_09343 [Thelohanellus kitauei]|uniref:Uncharacterized protein n=1 Tax=Thelohanellus kitauei TaxID=669202 RepID=A0A0C2IFS0_THEKT|nr:hypothetical protein RF11_09343 [Thelohanellus kitauei]